MEFWLMSERAEDEVIDAFVNNKPNPRRESFQLPVNPPAYEKDRQGNNGSFDIEFFGELSFLGSRRLETITINSFFPAKRYDFCLCTPKDNPYEYIKIIEAWWERKKPIRLIITETPVNMLCSIEDFTYGEKDGSRDVEFTLNLKEYRSVKGTFFNVH